jgi:predicted dehydrogenase
MSVAIGLIGCGRWGNNHQRVLAELRREGHLARLVVCDIDATRTRDLEADARYTSLGDMLAAEHLDGVAIVTPPETHLQLARQAMDEGVPVLVEKPLSEDHEENERFLATIDHGTLVVGYILRHHGGVQRFSSTEIREALGDVVAVRYVRRTPRQRPQGAAPVPTLGVHAVDLIAWLLDQPLMSATTRFTPMSEDEASAHLEFPSGAIGRFDVAWSADEEERLVEVKGVNGRAHLDFGSGTFTLDLDDEPARTVPVLAREPLRAEWEFFLKRCRSPEPTVFPSKQRLLDQSAWVQAHSRPDS